MKTQLWEFQLASGWYIYINVTELNSGLRRRFRDTYEGLCLPCKNLRDSLHNANKVIEYASWVSAILNERLCHKVSEAGDIYLQAMLQPNAVSNDQWKKRSLHMIHRTYPCYYLLITFCASFFLA